MECERTPESAVEAEASEATVEAESAAEAWMECERASEATVEAGASEAATAKTTTESKAASAKATTAKAAPAKATTAKPASAKTATAKADLVNVVAMVNRLCDTEGTAAGNGRRSQRTTRCHNRHGGQTNRYPARHYAHSITLSTPTVVNQTQRSYRGCNRAAQSRGVRQERPVRRKVTSPRSARRAMGVPEERWPGAPEQSFMP